MLTNQYIDPQRPSILKPSQATDNNENNKKQLDDIL